jgi:hypothetical protein
MPRGRPVKKATIGVNCAHTGKVLATFLFDSIREARVPLALAPWMPLGLLVLPVVRCIWVLCI